MGIKHNDKTCMSSSCQGLMGFVAHAMAHTQSISPNIQMDRELGSRKVSVVQ